jgi:hypothetical protein
MGLNKHLTAFVLPGWGVFTWNFLPFGLQGGPSTYSRLIWKAFASFVGDNLQVYLDNIDFADGKRRVTWKDGKCEYEKIDESRTIDMQLDRLEFCIFPQFERFNMSVKVPDYYWVSYRERAVSGRVKMIILSLRLVGCDDRERAQERSW